MFVLLLIVAMGGGAWYFLSQPGNDNPETTDRASIVLARRTPVVARAELSRPLPRPADVLIPITQTATAQRQAVASAGKDDPFRTVTSAPKPPIAVAPVRILKLAPSVVAPPVVVAKEFFSKSIVVLGIVATPKDAYAILSFDGRSEIAHPGDAVKTAIVKSISAQSRTVTFRENGEEITRALEVGQ